MDFSIHFFGMLILFGIKRSVDNIPSIFAKCGPVTAKKYYDNPELFQERLKKDNAYSLYERNRKLVDFNEIPKELIIGMGGDPL